MLFTGFMLTKQGPKVLEYNVRFGDPETQPVMLRLQSDLVDLVDAAIDGRLHATAAQWDPRPSLGVVMAAKPYPETPISGDVIAGLDEVPANAKVFHAGTALQDGELVASGGRVLNVTATGTTVAEAQARAYSAVGAVDAPDLFCRRDIGWREVEREKTD